MSDTPETDDQPIIYALNELQYQILCVDLEFARRLERERDEARNEIEGWRNKWNIAVEMAARAENERDEARKDLDFRRDLFALQEKQLNEARASLDEIRKRADYNLDLAKKARDLWEECEKERDEAREALEEEMKFHHRTHAELVQTQCKLLDMEMKCDQLQDEIKRLKIILDLIKKDAI